MITSEEVRKLFFDFFKKRGHSIVKSSSLIPENDPSVLLTTAGMQQFKLYFLGEKDPLKDFNSQRVVSIQKCFRTTDINEIGDERHLTFFEMLGNFSFGPIGNDDPNDFSVKGYFKKAAIFWAYEFLDKELGLKIDYVTVFEGDKNVPFDNISYEIWKDLGILEIRKAKREDNFWGPTGEEGPCGPTTEIYIDNIEVWNLVFNEYYADKKGNLRKLSSVGVDTGMGFERLMKVVQKKETIFETDLFEPLRTYILDISDDINTRDLRIVLDHLRGSIFLIADGVYPSNLERGYVLRRILRKLMLKIYKYNLNKSIDILVKAVINKFSTIYENLLNYDKIISIIYKEFASFEKTLNRGIMKFDKLIKDNNNLGEKLFILYSTHGLPLDISLELLRERNILYSDKDLNDFNKLFEEHRKISKENK